MYNYKTRTNKLPLFFLFFICFFVHFVLFVFVQNNCVHGLKKVNALDKILHIALFIKILFWWFLLDLLQCG